jgi:peptidoglycan hydrolase CwlO-like protein
MRLPRTSRFGRGRSTVVAEYRTGAVLSRGRVLVVALIVALASSVPLAPLPASAQSTGDQIAQTRSKIDDLAKQWFAGKDEAAKLDSQIAALQERVAAARAAADRTAVIARQRAVEIYMGSGTDLGPVLDSESALDSVRRAELLDRANAESERAIDDFESASERLDEERAALEDRRAEQSATVQQLAESQASLQTQLAGLQAQAQREAAAAAAAARVKAAATKRSTTRAAAPAPRVARSVPRAAARSGPAVVAAPPPPSSGSSSHHDDPFLVCTRARESRGNYGVVSASGKYYGAYQFAPTTWNVTASHAGRVDLVGVLPNQASVYDQDEMAWALYQWQGKAPWGGRC